ncbi:XVIPCD domain-containing protein [Stenotrophomonas nematodicola]|uniref:XVIPCD domain-containing protein n=2 Tax=Stenotrophomonas nematodicola TaxID=2656746 RepID=A0ABW7CX55_9GAMM
MLDPRIERMLEEANTQASLSEAKARDLREAIETSPFLADIMRKAMDSGDLKHIRFADSPNEGGHYDAKNQTISISSHVWDWPRQHQRVDQLTAVLGHETGHALMARSTHLTNHRLSFDIEGALKQGVQYGDATVDITPFAQTYINASRKNEGFAELVSMNAVASRIKTTVNGADLEQVVKRLDDTTPCVTDGKLATGIQIGPGFMQRPGTTIQSPAIEAVAVCQFDKSSSTLGVQGKADYNAYYLSYVVSVGAELLKERSQASTQTMPQVGMNLAELRSSVAEIQAAGVSLGGTGKVFGFADTSGGRHLPVEVRQVGPIGHAQPDIAAQQTDRPAAVFADHPAHADHATYGRIHEWVKGTGNWNEAESRNVAASLYKQQLSAPLVQRVDHVTGGLGRDGAHNVFAVYAPFGDKGPHFHTHVDGRQAAQEPAEQSLQQAEVLQRTQGQQQAQEQAQQRGETEQQAGRTFR